MKHSASVPLFLCVRFWNSVPGTALPPGSCLVTKYSRQGEEAQRNSSLPLCAFAPLREIFLPSKRMNLNLLETITKNLCTLPCS